MPVLGVGVANDLCEPGVLQLIHGLVQANLIGYLTVYVYDNYPHWFVDSMRQALPEQLDYVWHGSGDFELPLAEDSIESSWSRIDEVQRTWQPAWATEDLIVTTFGRTKLQGHPNYVPLFLTEDWLDVCVRRTRATPRSDCRCRCFRRCPISSRRCPKPWSSRRFSDGIARRRTPI